MFEDDKKKNRLDFIFNREKKQSKKKQSRKKLDFDRENQKAVLRCSICTGEQVAGFKNIHTGAFQDVMLIRNSEDLDGFMEMYGLDSITKEY